MSDLLDGLRRLVTSRPWVTIGVLFVVTVVLGAGATQRAEPPSTEATLPKEGRVAQALARIDELFGEHGEASVVTLLFRGDVLNPMGLSQMDDVIGTVISDPSIAGLLTPEQPILAPSLVINAALQKGVGEPVTQAEIDAALALPPVAEAIAAMTGLEADGEPIAVATVRLTNTRDERIVEAELRADELARDYEGIIPVSSISTGVVEVEYKKATEEGMAPLVGLAFLMIAALIFLFMRNGTDLLLTVGGLFLSIVWTVGIEGWLGPNALGLIGPPNSLTVLVPIIIIGLTVDYAIQIVSHYREQRAEVPGVLEAARLGLRNVSLPLTLAAVTTIVSLLVSLFSPLEIINDFGVVGGLGVGMSLLVMLTLIPAGRLAIDQRRARRGKLKPARPISTALPGVRSAAATLGRAVTRRPMPYILGVLAVTAGLGVAATDVQSTFSIQQILPRGGGLLEDLKSVETTLGGSTEIFSVLVEAEATETRTLLNLNDLTDAFNDESRRPQAATGPILASYDLVVRDWTHDSGEPGDRYDPQLAALLAEAAAGVEMDTALFQELLDIIETRDPTLRRFLVNNPDGMDAMLIQFPAFAGNPDLTRKVQGDLETLWMGDDQAITATSNSTTSFTVTDAITNQQSEAISTTLAVALTVLALFFWLTVRQPGLAFIAVVPIVLVLICVLGTMALLDIPYTLITSIITALSIGIGVDYTIHMIHRYREEYSHARDPEKAAIRTLSTTGSALLGSAMTTGLGLGVLMLAPVEASRHFGLTAAITIAYSLIISIILVPPAMTVWGSYQNVRLRSRMQRWTDELDDLIDAVHRDAESNQ